MYFAVLGKNPEISLAELSYAQPQNLKPIRNNIITFESDFPDRIKQLGGIIKWGRVVTASQIPEEIKKTKIIGINDENVGKKLKQEYRIKRYKLVKLAHTDKEVKEKGIEIIQINKESFGIVQGYQPIALYEVIDFEKPSRSMQMGMMPAKLAHIMLNIGLAQSKNPSIIYDPFIGSGTTGFLANHFGYDFIGSDIDTHHAQENIDRRKTTKFYNPLKSFNLFTHDIRSPLTKGLQSSTAGEGQNGGGFINGKGGGLIVTEGRLGPIIRDRSTSRDIASAQSQVLKLYQSFLQRIAELKATAIFTIPYYLDQPNTIEQNLSKDVALLHLHLTSIPEIYARADQKLGRKILIISQ